MLEIPESKVISRQADLILIGKSIAKVVAASSPHKFAWYNGSMDEYRDLLVGRTIESTHGHGSFLDIICNDDVRISISDGTNIKYYTATEQHPQKHQMLIEFTDNSFLAFTVAMYGSISVFEKTFDYKYYLGSINSISPLSDEFDEKYLETIFRSTEKNLSIKALLATEQRIPGLGNGVLQDILFSAGLHPKRKKETITDLEKGDLYHCMKVLLNSMTDKGGRDTEKDFFGNWGGYKTLLSKKTYKNLCPNCGNEIIKEAYLGGTIYFCTLCQKL